MSARLDETRTQNAASATSPRGILPSGLPDLPSIPPYDEVGPLDARALSKTLFARLETLEEGTPSTRTSAAP